jgi:DSF synthase
MNMENLETREALAAQVVPCPSYSQLAITHDAAYRTDWCFMKGDPRPCFTPTMLKELQHYANHLAVQADREVHYMVQASSVPGIFNYGGDLNLFRQLIAEKDREALLSYARSCINAIYGGVIHFTRDITAIALVEGDALGGGFECALACDVIIAEKNARMGLPEILFNLFPGMGAYSFLSRRIGPSKAQRLIESGIIHTAQELYDMGVVDHLAEEGQGKSAVYNYIRKENKFRNGMMAIREVKKYVDPVSYEELIHITEIWVDAALRLTDRDLRMMERLVARQTAKPMGNG